jgi:hypothetical protein
MPILVPVRVLRVRRLGVLLVAVLLRVCLVLRGAITELWLTRVTAHSARRNMTTFAARAEVTPTIASKNARSP